MMDSCEAEFVGRAEYLQDICGERGEQYQIYGLYGQAGVGKTRIAKHCIKIFNGSQLPHYEKKQPKCIDLRAVHTQQDFLTRCSLNFDLKPQDRSDLDLETHKHIPVGSQIDSIVQNWIHTLEVHLKKTEGCPLVVLFDNADDIAENQDLQTMFLKVCTALVECKLAKVFITSRIRFKFARLIKVYYDCTVKPMAKEESAMLLQQEAPGVDFGEHLQTLVNLCHGIPLAIILIASELQSNDGIYSVEDMVNLLTEKCLPPLSNEAYSREEQMSEVIGGSILRLKEKLQDLFAQINYIPGTFSPEAAGAVIAEDKTYAVKSKAMIPLYRRSLVTYDSEKQRFDIHSFLREWLDSNLEIQHLPEVRGRYAHFFGQILMKLQKELDSTARKGVLVSLATDMPNLQKLLLEGIHCSTDTFHVYMELARGANSIIENYMPRDAIKFYEDLSQSAAKFGTEMDQGIALTSVGMITADVKGDRDGALKHYEKACGLLEKYGDRPELALLYRYLAWNEMFRGQHESAMELGRKSVEMRLRIGEADDLQAATTYNVYGVILMNAGYPADALPHLQKALQLREELLPPGHLSIAAQYNNLGHCYGKIGNKEESLRMKEKSFQLKKEANASAKTLMLSVISLSDDYKRNGDLKKAEALLQEGLKIYKENGLNPGNKAGMLTHLGDVYMLMKKDDEACKMYREAVDIAEEFEQKRVLVLYLVQFGKVLLVAQRFRQAKEVLYKAVSLKSLIAESETGVFEAFNSLIQAHLLLEEYEEAISCYYRAFEELKGLYSHDLVSIKDGTRSKYVDKVVEFKSAWQQFFPDLNLGMPGDAIVKNKAGQPHRMNRYALNAKYPKPLLMERKDLVFWKRSLAFLYSTYYPKPETQRSLDHGDHDKVAENDCRGKNPMQAESNPTSLNNVDAGPSRCKGDNTNICIPGENIPFETKGSEKELQPCNQTCQITTENIYERSKVGQPDFPQWYENNLYKPKQGKGQGHLGKCQLPCEEDSYSFKQHINEKGDVLPNSSHNQLPSKADIGQGNFEKQNLSPKEQSFEKDLSFLESESKNQVLPSSHTCMNVFQGCRHPGEENSVNSLAHVEEEILALKKTLERIPTCIQESNSENQVEVNQTCQGHFVGHSHDQSRESPPSNFPSSFSEENAKNMIPVTVDPLQNLSLSSVGSHESYTHQNPTPHSRNDSVCSSEMDNNISSPGSGFVGDNCEGTPISHVCFFPESKDNVHANTGFKIPVESETSFSDFTSMRENLEESNTFKNDYKHCVRKPSMEEFVVFDPNSQQAKMPSQGIPTRYSTITHDNMGQPNVGLSTCQQTVYSTNQRPPLYSQQKPVVYPTPFGQNVAQPSQGMSAIKHASYSSEMLNVGQPFPTPTCQQTQTIYSTNERSQFECQNMPAIQSANNFPQIPCNIQLYGQAGVLQRHQMVPPHSQNMQMAPPGGCDSNHPVLRSPMFHLSHHNQLSGHPANYPFFATSQYSVSQHNQALLSQNMGALYGNEQNNNQSSSQVPGHVVMQPNQVCSTMPSSQPVLVNAVQHPNQVSFPQNIGSVQYMPQTRPNLYAQNGLYRPF